MTDNIFLIGNSLTWDTLPKELEGNVQYHISASGNLKYIFNNPSQYQDTPAVKSTSWIEAFSENEYDYVVVQTFRGTTLQEDVEIISHWMDLQPSATFVINTGWNRYEKHDQYYYLETTEDLTIRSQDYILDLQERLSQLHPDREIKTTRGLEVMEKINQDIKNNVSPFSKLSDLYRDGLHMSDGIRSEDGNGRYLMHNLMRLALNQPLQHNPELNNAKNRGLLSSNEEINEYLDNIIFSLKDEQELKGDDKDNNIIGTAKKDILSGMSGNDTLNGRLGDDLLRGNDGEDRLNGDSGNDTLNGDTGNDSLDGGNGDNLLNGGEGDDSLIALGGNDTMMGSMGNDTIFARKGNDSLSGDEGNDRINGGLGDDFLSGGDDVDTLIGAGGNDTLIGGFGNDILNGGRGFDVFRFNSFNEGIDNINDFSSSEDTLEILNSGIGNNLTPGVLDASQFLLGLFPTNSQHRFIYDFNSGNLFFDGDGDGVNNAIHIAYLQASLSLTHQNIVIT